MQKTHASSGEWDWASVFLLFLALQIVVARLLATRWTSDLSILQSITTMGYLVGLSLGYTRFTKRTARWLSFFYMLLMLPLQWTALFEEGISLEERLTSIGGRLLNSLSDFVARQPVEDPLFFIAAISIAFWIIGASAGFNLIRHQNFIASILPSSIGILIIQHYDNAISGRVWILAIFAFLSLLLLGRLNFLREQNRWQKKRVMLSPESRFDFSSGTLIFAGLLILIAWTFPPSFERIEPLRETWEYLSKPWRDFTKRMENAFSALEGSSGGTPIEFYGTELELGLGFPLSEEIIFTVQTPQVNPEIKPPRYYWRGRAYDYFDERWYITGTQREEYSPDEGSRVPPRGGESVARFTFRTSGLKTSLLHLPSEPLWVSRPGSYLAASFDGQKEIVTWNAVPTLLPGEIYQVDALLINPTIQDLQAAGTTYPAWLTEKYLQLPEDFSPRIRELAQEITANADTPYDKAVAITRYLRETIEYTSSITAPPRDRDPLEWILFEEKQGYCVYYATLEVLMLRSVGVPARLAAGFAQGENPAEEIVENRQTHVFIVKKKDAHAWPEVYFPNIGWVEFEPTGNQPPLTRPSAPPNPTANFSLPLPNANFAEDLKDELLAEDLAPENPSAPPSAQEDTSLLFALYLIPLFIAFAALTILLSRRYNVPARAPVLLRATLERSGIRVPPWLVTWEQWTQLSPTEKAFESINFALRLLGKPAPIHATPAERAHALIHILPHLETAIKTLLDEHQTSLYTSRKADEVRARRAALHIRTQALIAVIRHFISGTYSSPMN